MKKQPRKVAQTMCGVQKTSWVNNRDDTLVAGS